MAHPRVLEWQDRIDQEAVGSFVEDDEMDNEEAIASYYNDD
jgi:hypothetical protein